MKPSCAEPLSTGISPSGESTYTECGRKTFKDTGMCWHHAREAKILPRVECASVKYRKAHGTRMKVQRLCVVCGKPFYPWAQRPGECCGRRCAAINCAAKRRARREVDETL